HSPRALADLLDRFAVDDRRKPDGPIGRFPLNLRRRAAFIDAVVPFAQLVVDCGVREARKRAGLAGSLERARPGAQFAVFQESTDSPGAFAPFIGKKNIGASRVATGSRPFGFTMPDEEDLALHSGLL